MGEITKQTALILSQKCIAPDIFDLVLKAPEIAAKAKPGQFVNIYLKNASKILPRPISLCGFDAEEGTLRVVYRAGRETSGTRELCAYTEGEKVEVTGPLGNGFTPEGERPLLIGGGIGIPPMLELAKTYKKAGIRPVAALGYRTAKEVMYLLEEFKEAADVVISTDDGSFGTHGTVIDAIEANHITADAILACGPTPMLRSVKYYGEKVKVPTWVSMEARMACGIGACLACVCKTAEVDGHSHVHNARVCKEGPVFPAETLDL